MSALNSSRIFHGAFELDPCPCAPVWSDQSRGTSCPVPCCLGKYRWGLISFEDKGSNHCCLSVWLGDTKGPEQFGDRGTVSMKMCTSGRAGIANLDEVSRVKYGAGVAGAHQAASLGTNFLF